MAKSLVLYRMLTILVGIACIINASERKYVIKQCASHKEMSAVVSKALLNVFFDPALPLSHASLCLGNSRYVDCIKAGNYGPLKDDSFEPGRDDPMQQSTPTYSACMYRNGNAMMVRVNTLGVKAAPTLFAGPARCRELDLLVQHAMRKRGLRRNMIGLENYTYPVDSCIDRTINPTIEHYVYDPRREWCATAFTLQLSQEAFNRYQQQVYLDHLKPYEACLAMNKAAVKSALHRALDNSQERLVCQAYALQTLTHLDEADLIEKGTNNVKQRMTLLSCFDRDAKGKK